MEHQTMKNKKKILNKKRIFIIIGIVILLILFFPIPIEAYEDGGTTVHSALAYTVYNYNRMLYEDGYFGYFVGIRIEAFNRTIVSVKPADT